MAEENRFHLSGKAAETYEQQKMPAIFAPMARATLDAIALPDGCAVIDIACGTGAVARAVADRLSAPSRIVGTDLNPAMIELARQNTPRGIHAFEWLIAPAEAIPLDGGSFGIAFCQQGLQFFPDRPAALREMRRLLRPSGRLILTCWAGVPPFFEVVSEVLGRHVGPEVAKVATAPFTWNDGDHIRQLIAAAGFECAEPSPLPLERVMPASADAMRRELLATPNEAALLAAGDDTMATIVAEILAGVEYYRHGDQLRMPQVAHLFEAVAV